MKKLVSTLNLDKKEWLKYRKGGIGGSDAGAICGLNPYRTAIQVYNDKRTDEIEEFDNEAMREGRDLEEYVARRFVEATGKKVRRANAMFCDEENPFMLADVDRMIVGENAGLECKTASPFSADKWEDDKIPLSYQIQCYHYMSVMNADRWYVAVLIYGTEFKVYCLERDEEMIQNLIHLENDFWNNHVQAGVIPAPDGSKLADKVLAEYFSDPVDETVELKKFSGFNFRLSLKRRVITIFDTANGEIQEFSYGVQVQVTMKNGTKKISNEVVDHDKIKSIQWLTKATNSLAYIPKGKEEKIAYEAMVQECIEQEAEAEWIYPSAGWREIPKLGWRYVYKDGIIGGSENVHTAGKNYSLDVKKEQLGEKEVFDNVMGMKNICGNVRTSLEMLIFVHAGLLTTLFERAGH